MRPSTFGLVLAATSTLGCSDTSWGLQAIDSMRTPDDPPLAGPLELPEDTRADERAACRFTSGSMAADTLRIPPDVSAKIPVRHVIVVMRENRSFDHLLGGLGAMQSEADIGTASFANRDHHGGRVGLHHARTTCIDEDPDHQWDAMHAMVDGGTMQGFVRSAAESTGSRGHFAMSRYEQDDLPFYHWLASTFALSDRHFASICSGTDPNRDFLLFGTNAGIKETGADTPDPSTPSVMRALMDRGFTWGAYSDGFVFGNALGWDGDEPGTHSLEDFFRALDHGTLPNVAFVDGVDDDGATSDVQVGEAWLRKLYTHAVRSPQWLREAIVWTYDEAGGFADHVAPPTACGPTGDGSPRELGPRVPLVVVSPWAKPHHVSHAVEEHTAITRFIEVLFDLPALTARDANSGALLDLFDFSGAPPLLVPPGAPASGRGGCR